MSLRLLTPRLLLIRLFRPMQGKEIQRMPYLIFRPMGETRETFPNDPVCLLRLLPGASQVSSTMGDYEYIRYLYWLSGGIS